MPVASKNEPDKPKEEPEPVEAKPDPAQAPSAAAEATPPQDAGGAAAPGAATKAQVAMAASGGASPAAVARYKRSVVESLAAHKPKGKPGIRGTVRVAFKISRVGEIDSARVVNSSGRKELDEAALSAVQATRFQPPPPGLTTDDLHYEIPYYFR